MAIIRLEHVGIAVKDLAASREIFDALFDKEPYKQEHVDGEAVNTLFYATGESKIELLEATADTSAIAGYLAKRGEGIHHLAFESDDLDADLIRLQDKGFVLIHQTPKPGADNKRIAFLHPKSTNSVLVELCQTIV